MITYTSGNILEAKADALVNTVNTVGVMGKGVAYQFKRAFPEIVAPYETACKSGELETGRVFTVKLATLEGPRYVVNFPTKKHWRGKSKIEYIDTGLESLVEEVARLKIKSIAIPPLGCGLGGLAWDDVKSRIEDAFESVDGIDVIVYIPSGKPAARDMKVRTQRPMMTSGKAVLLTLMKRYLLPLMDDSVSLLEIQKLMYFMQETGYDLQLKYEKGTYGPYAVNLRHLLSNMEGHFVLGFGDASEEPGKEIETLPGAFENAERYLSKKPEIERGLSRVVALIDGFETAYGMELLSSVHWVATHEEVPAKTSAEAVQLVHAWNDRKNSSFRREHIEAAWDRLTSLGWI